MGSYTFNPHRHVRIWVSKVPNVFLNLENQLRLADMRQLNPDDEIYFLYDASLLTESALEKLRLFCAHYRIIPKELENDIFSACTTKDEWNLVRIYRDEIGNLERGGNLGAACDVLRWISPVYRLGTYSDFDVEIDTRKLPKTLQVKGPLLLPMNSIIMDVWGKKFESIGLHNDVIAVVNEEACKEQIVAVQQGIHRMCHEPAVLSNEYHLKVCSELCAALGSFRFNLLDVDAFTIHFNTFAKVAHKWKDCSSREIRGLILRQTEHNAVFCAPQSVTEYAQKIRLLMASKRRFSGLFFQDNEYQQKIRNMSILSDEELVDRVRLQARFARLATSVINTTGPYQLARILFPKVIFKPGELNAALTHISLAENEALKGAFKFQLDLGLHVPITKAKQFDSAVIGETGDLSWLFVGEQAIAAREEKILASGPSRHAVFM